MISRRRFLTSSAFFGAAFLVRPTALFSNAVSLSLAEPLLTARRGETLITFLHTNDTHSQIDPVPRMIASIQERAGLRVALPLSNGFAARTPTLY